MDVEPLWEYFRPCRAMDNSGCWHILSAVLQHFSRRRAGWLVFAGGGLAFQIAGWRCRVRIYSRRSTETFGVPVEEFDEAYLSAKSP
jgi:hypothetical protein